MKAMMRLAAALLLLPLTPAGAQQDITRRGTVPHEAARTGFPERVGEFRRAQVTRFDPDGRDISASYNLVRPGGRLLLSIYIYPAARVASAPGSGATADVARAQLCRREFAGVHQAINVQYRGVTLIEQGPAPAVADVPSALSLRSVHQFRAQFDERMQDVRSETDLYCHVGGDWLVKYRVTAPRAFEDWSAVEGFIRSGPWPGRRLGSSGDVAGAPAPAIRGAR